MGCDIHAHTELKINGEWQHMSVLQISRNYELFAYMAGVRSGTDDRPGVAQDRGIPKDATIFTNFDYVRWGIDGHSHSWMSAAEVAALGDWLEDQWKRRGSKEFFYCEKVIGYIFGNGWDVFTKYRDDLPEGVTDARMIFWFDN